MECEDIEVYYLFVDLDLSLYITEIYVCTHKLEYCNKLDEY